MVLYVGEGSEREQCHLLSSLLVFSHFFSYPQSNQALLLLIPGWVGLLCSRTLWVSPMNSPLRLEVTLAVSVATGFSVSIPFSFFEALCACTRTLDVQSAWLPSVPHDLSARKCGTTHSTSQHLTRSASHCLACPSPPATTPTAVSPLLYHCHEPISTLLPVWMNVSSLTPWLSDFHTV